MTIIWVIITLVRKGPNVLIKLKKDQMELSTDCSLEMVFDARSVCELGHIIQKSFKELIGIARKTSSILIYLLV